MNARELRMKSLANFRRYYFRGCPHICPQNGWGTAHDIFVGLNLEKSHQRMQNIAGPHYHAYLRAAELLNPELKLSVSKTYIKKIRYMRKLER